MRYFTLTALICAILTVYSCKKTTESHTPDTTPDNVPQWQLIGTNNSPLPDGQVNAIAISNDDTKWIATANGLVMLKGDQWKVYNTQNTTLPSNFIQAVVAGDNGTVWVGTNKGLARWNGHAWSVFTINNSSLPDKAIMSLAFDKLNHRLWAGTTKGLLSIDADGTQLAYTELEDELPLSMVVDQMVRFGWARMNTLAFAAA